MFAASLFFAVVALTAADDPQCRSFKDIYANGKNLCERMFDGAFEYVPTTDANYSLAYTMWWFDENNPNAQTTASRLAAGFHHVNYSDVGTCYMQYLHHDAPQKNQPLRECQPFAESACCKEETVLSPNTLKEGYGAEWHWDRCGPLSQSCERFFVQEACLYECDQSASLFRKYAPHLAYNDTEANEWEMQGMPIKGDYCDAWFDACQYDMFCSSDDGSFFTCAKEYQAASEGLSGGIIALIVILSLLFVGLAVAACVMVRREKMGNPIFQPLSKDAENRVELTGQEHHVSIAQT